MNLHLSFDWQTGIPALTVLTIVFIISVFKKTGRISDVSWALIILAVTGLGIETKDVISQPFKSFRIWLGAVKNYLIVYTLLLGGKVVGALAPKLATVPLTKRYAGALGVLLVGLFLTCTDWTYLWGNWC